MSKVPPKAKGKRGRGKETVKPLSGLDVEEILNQDKTLKISQENAIPDFKQMIRRSSEDSDVEDAAKQMGKIIRNMITDTTGHQGYDQALAYMRVSSLFFFF
jgi:ATP-dependent DNA helicase 2 subunit 2